MAFDTLGKELSIDQKLFLVMAGAHIAGRGITKETFIAGGAVRDLLLDLPVRDIDIWVLEGKDAPVKKVTSGSGEPFDQCWHEKLLDFYGHGVDLIGTPHSDPISLLETFPVGISQVAHYRGGLIYTKEFERDFKNKTITVLHHGKPSYVNKVWRKLHPLGFAMAYPSTLDALLNAPSRLN